ncbi:hypothetical protein LSTR_LSTR007931 [Laodelphax striatellus]|uniref:non-specific serine/threonine protein kinase n=1 Tax=Laodelphax striatellus TaxID=195883 RepID=A0A482XRK2_LAOST|nr:hypothetical protein LSTR_LSTR007931 [Laodelphax striatellus]
MEVNLFKIFLYVHLFGSIVKTDDTAPNFSFVTSLVKEDDISVLVLSTLEGSFIGIDQWTGKIRWKLTNEPTVKVPISKDASMPMFLPDPKDGSLYLLSKNTEELKKLPFTIPQLVASSPCRSSDGIFYTGRKIDSWFAVNWKTGVKKSFMTFDQSEKTCPVTEPDHVFIGRTEYNLIMYDGKKQGKHWNITFFDYSAQALQSDQLANYELAHFGGSASGRVSTYDRRSGALLWEHDFGSPMVALYARSSCGRNCNYGGGQDLVSVPFASVDDATLDRLPLFHGRKDQLSPTLYIGEHRHGLYALPSLVGSMATIGVLSEASGRHLLIDGPQYNQSDSSNRALLVLAGDCWHLSMMGEFDARAVAVKRLLPDCFTLADREVRMLRESDAHPNVVRYFCTEHDAQFRYIALELCAATLQDYVERRRFTDVISPEDVLKQSTAGLMHLHNLNIVHRDIKPHNVLLSGPAGPQSAVRAMISDFGLCKKLQLGRTSFSRTSGVTGTEGWIAPEMLLNNRPTTCSVDIFSLGCVFYYVLSKGKHPFGDPLRRQANILSSDYDLSAVEGEQEWRPWRSLIEKMVVAEPSERPPVHVVSKHPVFWDKATVLAFLQDVSDRVEKDELASSAALRALECGGRSRVCGGDWQQRLEPQMAAELRRYRAYRGDSVRDLLRALRNKKHHLRELSEEAKQSVGSSTDSFVDYWLSRFPALFEHSWVAMQCLRNEHSFRHYYSHSFEFPPLGGASGEEEDYPMPLLVDSVGGGGTPAQKRKNGRSRGGGPRRRHTENSDESDREKWRQNGERNGVWRPRRGGGRRTKNEVEGERNPVWVLPES